MPELVRCILGSGGIPVIVLTGYGQEEDRQRTRNAGFDDYLVKPVDLEALINLLIASLLIANE